MGATADRTLVVAGKLPPDVGGIQTFTEELAARLGTDVVVAAPKRPGSHFDRLDVVRLDHLSVDRASADALAAIVRDRGCGRVWFSAAGPLSLLAPGLRAAGAHTIVSSTHGHELTWSRLPGGRALIRRMARDVDVMTVLTPWAEQRFRRIVGEGPRLALLSGGVDVERFAAVDRDDARRRLGHGDEPVVIHVGRLVRRKGQDVVIRAVGRLPGVRLVVVGTGPDAEHLARLAARHAPGRVLFTGAIDDGALVTHLAAADAFAMPSRTRWGGLDVEGLGISALEAAAAGLPVIAGRSGGAPASVIEGETGHAVDGRDVDAVTEALRLLVSDPSRARAMGAAGQEWAHDRWSWDTLARRLAGYLELDQALVPAP